MTNIPCIETMAESLSECVPRLVLKGYNSRLAWKRAKLGNSCEYVFTLHSYQLYKWLDDASF